MPFMRMQEATALATSIDTAMNRRDEVGMEMLRDLLPELREIIDDVNAALREVDELLFTGLRDEAVSLNDPEFSRMAARLNLEDKAAWPEAQVFFEREGITPPPSLDFETLAALESAHAELESLGRPLDRIRRLVLERAPILQRLDVLRRLRDADGTKPVWADTIADHERARLAELPEAVKRAFAAKDPAAIAALHAELVDPEWSVSVPKDLVKATRGAELWVRLRESVPAAEHAAAALESGLAAAESALDPSAIAALRQARQEWYQEAGAVKECEAGLAQCPKVAALAQAEGLGSRFDALTPKVQPALAWLEAIDAQDAAMAGQAQAVSQLEWLLANPPKKPPEEPSWLATVASLQRQFAGQGGLPEGLRSLVAAAVAEVQRRPTRRLLVKGALAAAVLATLCVALLGVNSCRNAVQERERTISMLRQELTAANAGRYVVVPEKVNAAKSAYPDDEEVQELVAEIERAVEKESRRRRTLSTKLEDQTRWLDEAQREVDNRIANGTLPAPWPDVIGQAAAAWREARQAGKKDDESVIDASRKKQEDMERKFELQAKSAFETRLDELREAMKGLPETAGQDEQQKIRDGLMELGDAGRQSKPSDGLRESTWTTLVPPALLDDLRRLQAEFERRINSSPVPPGSDAP